MSHEGPIEGAGPSLVRADQIAFGKDDQDFVAEVREAGEELLHGLALAGSPSIFAVMPEIHRQKAIDGTQIAAIDDLFVEVADDGLGIRLARHGLALGPIRTRALRL